MIDTPTHSERLNAGTRIIRTLLISLTAFLTLQLISLYLSWPKQAVLGCVSIIIGIVVNRISASRIVTLALMLVSLTATLRYGWWRVRLLIDYFLDQSNNRVSLDSVFMLILISAEIYTVLIMILGYMQTAWPLQRKPILLPNDYSLWPHVDVLIPTYNEPLPLVRYTTLAANNIDYPPDKLHVYILDDGSREEFRAFAAAAGVGYITRKEHAHAKAGNINHALTTMNSPYVTIFDCDHVPTRSFLQMTLGWMLVDSNLAMLQTPHHFYSPDPFERNLLQYKTIPNEAALFYGIIQDGNDFWNATFFCGSCALLRRSALDKVGGIATETVTEDAHTSLRMQKLGYNTAYINIPQAAGLATETLAAHVGQRIRWARGMIQIFRTDNPLFASGMKLTQRLCYLNAMIHFLYAVPRLVFLGAPLVYMLLGRTIIPGYWVAILAYSIPHLILSSLTNSRIQGRHRHSFWNEIYEAVLAPYILAPTLLALINPKLGKFNVTDKGGTLSDTRFDRKISTPTRWMLALNFIGVLVAPYRMFIKDPTHPGTVIMNLVWILFNIVILGVAAAVAHEQKQRRQSVRIEARIPMNLQTSNGTKLVGVSIDMSVGGASVRVEGASQMSVGDNLRLSFPEHSGDDQIGARVVGVDKDEVRLSFLVPTISEQETLTRALYSRADAWISSTDSKEVDRPLRSLGRVIRLSWYGIYQICRTILPEKEATPTPGAAQTAILLLLASILGYCSQLSAAVWNSNDLANTSSHTTITSHGPVSKSNRASKTISEISRNVATPPSTTLSNTTVHSISLKDMGLLQGIDMRGPHAYSSLTFVLPHTLVPRRSTLRLRYEFDHGVDEYAVSVKLTLNGTRIATISPSTPAKISDGLSEADIAVPEDVLLRTNSLVVEMNSTGAVPLDAQRQARILCRISSASVLDVQGDQLHWQNDLSQLPLPFFDSDLQTATTVQIVFLAQPSTTALEAAGAVTSWLGLQARSKSIRFTTSLAQIPRGNAILFSSSRRSLPATLTIPAGDGPMLALRDNPSDPGSNLLVVAGNDDEQLLSAARTLALTRKASDTTAALGQPLKGNTAELPALTMPASREKDDAPKWVPMSTDAHVTHCDTTQALQTDGSTPIPVYFHLRPDIFYGERQNVTFDLHYRYNALAVAAGSALRVMLNGKLINEIPLPAGKDFLDRQREILVPVADLRSFGNTMLFNFDFNSAKAAGAEVAPADALQGNILCNSSLDLHGLASWTQMPNLELFAEAGYPFSQHADLSETTIVLPLSPSVEEITLYLTLLSYFGEQTGYPALRIKVNGPNTTISKGRDYLVLGTVTNQPSFASLDSMLTATLDTNGIHVKPMRNYLSLVSSITSSISSYWSQLLGNAMKNEMPSNISGIPNAMIEQIQSPSESDRSIVIIVLQDSSTAPTLADALLDKSASGDVAGSVSLLRKGKFESYLLEVDTYQVGNISWYARMRIWMAQHFLLLFTVVSALSLLMAVWMREWLSDKARERLRHEEPMEVVA